jgi:cytidine deaminase
MSINTVNPSVVVIANAASTNSKEIIMNATTLVIATIAALRQHIISSCIEASGGQLFPCTKQSVYAVVITADGRAYYGANWMTASDVTICPRILANTTSYELCSTVCGQGTEFHAERQAMWSALYDDADLTGAEVFITGHTYCCDTCRAAMLEEGIIYAGSLDSGRYYGRGESDMIEVTAEKPVRMMANMSLFDLCRGGDVITIDEYTHSDGTVSHKYQGNVVIEGRQVEYLCNVSLGHFN